MLHDIVLILGPNELPLSPIVGSAVAAPIVGSIVVTPIVGIIIIGGIRYGADIIILTIIANIILIEITSTVVNNTISIVKFLTTILIEITSTQPEGSRGPNPTVLDDS